MLASVTSVKILDVIKLFEFIELINLIEFKT